MFNNFYHQNRIYVYLYILYGKWDILNGPTEFLYNNKRIRRYYTAQNNTILCI